MIRHAFIATLLVSAPLVSAPLAHAQDITGDWIGRYICNQGITALHLVIQNTAKAGAITATFNFGPPPENPEVPKGAYTMRGTYDQKTRHVALAGDRWVKQPFGYLMVGLDGSVTVEGDKLAGRIPGMDGCSNFELRRTTPLIG